jgi:translation initiation factor 2 subunit 3
MDLFNQPLLNIGTLGNVSDGKSTMVYELTGIKTQKNSNEKIRNITIKQGYANLKIWKCNECNQYNTNNNCCNNECELVNHISFVDCPGHQTLTLTMLSSISLMNGVIIVVSAGEPIIEKPQLIQHLKAVKLSNIKKIIICFNKLDLISKELAIERKIELDMLLKKLDIIPLIIIPTSFNKRWGLDKLLKFIMMYFSYENIIDTDNTLFRITRTFDVNKPGTNWDNIIGGVIGGSLITGNLKINDEIEIGPGIIYKEGNKIKYETIKTKCYSIETNNQKIDEISPGGLVAIQTDIDPYYCKNDKLKGHIIAKIGCLPDIFTFIKLDYNNLDDTWTPKINDICDLQITNNSCKSKLIKITDNIFEFQLSEPVCVENNIIIIICYQKKIVAYGNQIKN